jgi:hypothetical protein
MMSASYLRHLAGERLISLLLNKSPNDKRSIEQLRIEAAKQVVREQRIANKSTAPSTPTPNTPFELLFAKIWRICQNMNAHELMQRGKSQATPKLEITPASNPVVVNDTPVSLTNVLAFPTKEKPAPLLSTSLRTAELLPDHEFPRLGGMADETTNNWRASIQQNEQIAKQREIASARHRSQQKYVG